MGKKNVPNASNQPKRVTTQGDKVQPSSSAESAAKKGKGSGTKLVSDQPKASSAKLATQKSETKSCTDDFAFCINVTDLVNVPNSYFQLYFRSLHVMSKLLHDRPFVGTAEDILRLEDSITTLDLLMASDRIYAGNADQFLTDCNIPPTARDWMLALSKERKAVVEALIPVADAEVNALVASGVMPEEYGRSLDCAGASEPSTKTLSWAEEMEEADADEQSAKKRRVDDGYSAAVRSTIRATESLNLNKTHSFFASNNEKRRSVFKQKVREHVNMTSNNECVARVMSPSFKMRHTLLGSTSDQIESVRSSLKELSSNDCLVNYTTSFVVASGVTNIPHHSTRQAGYGYLEDIRRWRKIPTKIATLSESMARAYNASLADLRERPLSRHGANSSMIG